MHAVLALLVPFLLALSTPIATPGTPDASPQASPEPTPIVLNVTLAIEAYPTDAELEPKPVADLGGPLQMAPGEARRLAVGTYECCYIFEPRDLDVIWTVSPVEGVSIDPSGLLTVGAEVPDGTVITVAANRDPVGPSASVYVYVFDPAEQPLVGLWRETAQVACDDGAERAPAEPIGELRFDADGTFSVTWHPFEVYRDYWGTYAYDRATGELRLTVESGNIATPVDFDGEGTVEVREDGSLALEGIWLGSPPGGDADAPGCGHVFAAM